MTTASSLFDPPKDVKYPLSWARSILDKLEYSYPRATDFVRFKLKISYDQWAFFLCRGDPVWYHLRDFVHYVNSCLPLGTEDALNACVVDYVRILRRLNRFRLAEALDRALKAENNEYAVVKGGPE